jgi:hypothetical protein
LISGEYFHSSYETGVVPFLISSGIFGPSSIKENLDEIFGPIWVLRLVFGISKTFGFCYFTKNLEQV